MRRVIIFLIVLIILGGAIWFGWRKLQPPEVKPEPTPVAFQEQQALANLSVRVQTQADEQPPRLFTCEVRVCHSESWPSTVPDTAVTDGNIWYYYADGALTRHEPGSGDTQPFVKKTSLVAPRDHLLSPSGEALAYFLDNIHDQKSKLSELWVYEAVTRATRLVVENITVPNMLTTPRWNSAGNHLWYVADNGVHGTKKIELVVVSTGPAHAQARFNQVPWAQSELQQIAEQGVLDISFTGRSLAFAQPISKTRSRITVIHEGTPLQSAPVQGTIPYVQWLEDGRLIYAVQEDHAFGFWQLRSTIHTFIARREGQLVAARADSAGERLAAAVRSNNRERLAALHLSSRTFQDVAALPTVNSQPQILVLQRTETATPAESSVAGITAPLDDAQVTAFIEKHLPAIAGDPTARPLRVITTAQTNVIFLDYAVAGKQDHRLLLTVRDAINPEWSIRARYEPAAGEWRKTQGGGLPDPKPERVYEWEEDLKRWILKSQTK
jgi:hypothetical protein